MNQFFTTLPPQKQKPNISYNSKLFLIGSCFVENIGKRLDYHKFQTLINPFGIIFHPKAILKIIERISKQEFFTEKDVFFYNEQWHCFEVHSTLSDSNKINLIDKLNKIIETTTQFLKTSSHIVITYGSAWGYEYKKEIVANCHKVNQEEFSKTLYSVLALEECILQTIACLKKINEQLTVLVTIAPVRHIKDGIINNNLSKAHLISAVHNSIKSQKNSYYYPAYELVMDCLRDYRFYKSDLIHPNEIAIDFIWEHFQKTWIYDPKSQEVLKEVLTIQRGLAHKPFNKNSEAHKKFTNLLKEKSNYLISKYPFMKFDQLFKP